MTPRVEGVLHEHNRIDSESINSFIDGPELESTRDEFSNGDWYEGEHIKVTFRSEANGKTGTKALKHGKGTYSYVCGSLFEGYYFEDHMLEGRFYNAPTKTTYFGHFKDGLYHGMGKLTYPLTKGDDDTLEEPETPVIVEPMSMNTPIDGSIDASMPTHDSNGRADARECGAVGERHMQVAYEDNSNIGAEIQVDTEPILGSVSQKVLKEVEYTGDFFRGKRHGEGKLVLSDGSWILGSFKNDVLLASIAEEVDEHGMNSTAVRHMVGGIRYEGTFDGHYEMHTLNLPDQARTNHDDSQIAHDAGASHSKLTFRNGNKLSARFDHGKIILPAELTLASGDIWFGDLNVNYQACGKGKMRYKNGDVYIGTVKAGGAKEGQGLQIAPNGSSYNGEYVNDQFHGTGTFKFVDGASYEGEWSYGLRHGQGIMTYKTGNVYEGSWKQDKKHGPGKAVFLNGDTFTGTYANDRRDGDGLTIFADSNKPPERALYKGGQLVKVRSNGKVEKSVKFLGRKLGLRKHGDPV